MQELAKAASWVGASLGFREARLASARWDFQISYARDRGAREKRQLSHLFRLMSPNPPATFEAVVDAT